MVPALAKVMTLLLCGQIAVGVLGVPLPGAAVGLVGLFAYIAWCGGPDPALESIFDGIAPNASLLFVPAAVGVVANLDRLFSAWLLFVVAIVLGTGATLVITGLTLQRLARLAGRLPSP